MTLKRWQRNVEPLGLQSRYIANDIFIFFIADTTTTLPPPTTTTTTQEPTTTTTTTTTEVKICLDEYVEVEVQISTNFKLFLCLILLNVKIFKNKGGEMSF